MGNYKKKCCMFYPENKYKNAFDLIVALVLVISCILSPLYIAFESDSNEQKIGWVVTNWTIDAFFLIDIFTMFMSSYYDDDFRIVHDRKIIATKYVQGWFFIDVLAIIPFDLFFGSGGEEATEEGSNANINQLVRIARVGRLYKLIKLTRLLRVVKIVKEQGKFFKFFTDVLKVAAGFERLGFFIMIFLMLCHISACLWIIIP